MEADAKRVFNNCDKDKNGYLKIEEIKKCMVPKNSGKLIGGVYY